ncbi:MAG: hypothetical protein K8E66_05440 [Phycisphaerales bacterium]|nr:hypothetical protein [Phycisphaerales bacterium]
MARRAWKITGIAGLVAVAAGSANAVDGTNLIYNAGFEEVGVANPDLPQGWRSFNMSPSDYVDIGDPGAHVRTGRKSMRLRPSIGPSSLFQGFDTNVFLPDGSDLYDPDYEYLGGDVHVSGWYLVPEGETLANDLVALKLEFRREPPNFSVHSAFEFPVDVNATNGQWHYFEVTVTDEMMLGVGDFPPPPTSVSILPLRFFFGDYGTDPLPQGTIYWDDLCYVQGDLPAGCNAADIAEPYDLLDLADITAFINAFVNQLPAGDIAEPTGIWDLADITAFVNAFLSGCP